MGLINITSRQQKITPEEKCLNRMSELPFMNTLLKRTSHIKNTNTQFTGEYININADPAKLSRDVLSFQYKTELDSLKMHDHSINEKRKQTREILNERVTKWYAGEKITTPAAIIYREIDKVCAEKNINISTEEKEKILDIVNKKHINIDKLEKKASVSSMLSSLKSDRDLDGKINVPGIKKNLITDMKNQVPELFTLLTDKFHKNDAVKQEEKLLTPEERIIFNDIPVVREIAGKIATDVYGGLLEEIYNILFRDTETEQPLDFKAIKLEARKQAELILKDKASYKNSGVSTEDAVRRQFESLITVTTSSPEKDLEDIFNNQLKGDILDQRAQFNPRMKLISSDNIPGQDIDNIIDILNRPVFTDRTDDQRAFAGNKKSKYSR